MNGTAQKLDGPENPEKKYWRLISDLHTCRHMTYAIVHRHTDKRKQTNKLEKRNGSNMCRIVCKFEQSLAPQNVNSICLEERNLLVTLSFLLTSWLGILMADYLNVSTLKANCAILEHGCWLFGCYCLLFCGICVIVPMEPASTRFFQTFDLEKTGSWEVSSLCGPS